MKRWTTLAETTLPGTDQTMVLAERDGTRVIRVGGRELMSSRHSHSEQELARIACKGLRTKPDVEVLIGGLGLGLTLREALAVLGSDATVHVAELVGAVVQWHRDPATGLADISKHAVDDPRTRIIDGDVADVLTKARGGQFHAIMLDADNGTTAMCSPGNASLYERDGIAAVRRALRPDGTAVWWSAQAEPRFADRVGRAGFKVTCELVRGHADGGPRHTLVVARPIG